MTGILQGCLLAMGITFELRKARERRSQGEAPEENGDIREEDDDERTRLLDNER